MKKAHALILLSSLVFSSVTLANTSGPLAKCTAGKFNMQIYVKDIDSCPDDRTHGGYCIMDMWSHFRDDGSLTCEDFEDLFTKNDNESVSLEKMPTYAQLDHWVGNFKTQKEQHLYFTYDHGVVSENCAEAFGPDVRCAITKSGDSEHPMYTLIISKNS